MTKNLNANEKRWLERLAQYREFFRGHGRDPSKGSLDEGERRVGTWLSTQRREHRKGALSSERVAALESVRPDWCPDREEKAGQQWIEYLSEYQGFVQDHGRDPSQGSPDKDERRLSSWLWEQRRTYREGRLSPGRIAELDGVNPDWCAYRTSRWPQALDQYRSFVHEHGRNPLARSPNADEKRLGGWLSNQRTAHRKGALSPERVAALEKVDPNWCPDPEEQWLERLDECREFHFEHGRFPLRGSQNEDEKRLGTWLSKQRESHRKGALSPERVAALEKVDPNWCPPARRAQASVPWEARLEQYQEFFQKHGRDPLTVSPDGREKGLGGWLSNQRTAHRKGALSPERVAALEKVDPNWCPPARRAQASVPWEARLEQYQEFFQKHGRDPSTSSLDADEARLGGWLSKQRTTHRKGRLSPERVAELERVNPDWCPDPEERWLERLGEYQEFRQKHGRDPSQGPPEEVEGRLGVWLSNQRQDHREGRLSPDRVAELERVNPDWAHTSNQWTIGRIVDFIRDLPLEILDISELRMLAIQRGASPAQALRFARHADNLRDDLIGSALTEDEKTALIEDAISGDDTDDTEDEDENEGPELEDSASDLVAPVATEEDEGDSDADESARSVLDMGSPADLRATARALAYMKSRSTDGVGDAEAVEFLCAKAMRRIWNRIYHQPVHKQEQAVHVEMQVLEESRTHPDLVAEGESINTYYDELLTRFRGEAEATLAITAPTKHLMPGAYIGTPLIMQRHVASRLIDERRLGNFSGTGAGKTISAILAARVDESGRDGIVMVVCPNSVVDTWERELAGSYADHDVQVRTLNPVWRSGGPKWLVLNYDMFRDNNRDKLLQLVAKHRVDMLIMDEVHLAKSRADGSITSADRREVSQRRSTLLDIRTAAQDINPEVAVLGMSATPVINDLMEPVSLLTLIEGRDYSEVKTKNTAHNALVIHSHITRIGVRYMPRYSAKRTEVRPQAEGDHLANTLAQLKKGDVIEIERTLAPLKIGAVVREALATFHSGRRVLVYCHYITGIMEPLREALEAAGLRVGVFSGPDKSGRDLFTGRKLVGTQVRNIAQAEQVDVLLGSPAVSTGIDGLQAVSNTVIFASLPWTAAEHEQIVGRVLRTGQEAGEVRVVTPVTSVSHDAGVLRWEEQRLLQLEAKADLAAAVIDGVVPTSVGDTRKAMAGSHSAWVDRVVEHGLNPDTHLPPLEVDWYGLPLTPEDIRDMPRGHRPASEFTQMNSAWGRSSSQSLHRRLARDRSEWDEYHRMYRKSAKTWEHIPAHHFADWLNTDYRDYPQVVADLGCGERLLAKALTASSHTVHEFDHVAFDENVTVADISNVPLADGSVDIAVLSLALMGTNRMDYVTEACRILKPGGQLWLAEPTGKMMQDPDRIRAVMADYGLAGVDVETLDKFTVVRAARHGSARSSSMSLFDRSEEEEQAA